MRYFVDKPLFDRLKSRDKEAFSIFYSQSVDIFYRYIFANYGYLKKTEAEDILSDFYIKVWNKIQTVNSFETFKSWLFSVLNNSIKDYLKKKKEISFSALTKFGKDDQQQELQISSDEKSALDILEEDFQKEDIQKAISSLQDSYKIVLFLRFVEGKTNREIAGMLGISEQNVRQRLSRWLKILKKNIKKP